jgi:translation initiation factor 2 subunit 1
MKKQGNPERGELVVCKILKLYPNSAFAELIEYGKNGMIHVSEVASRWVRDIREFLKENQYVVCRVMGVDRDTISLSIKRVRREQTTSKLNEFKRERKAEKMLELAGKGIKKNLEDMYKEVGFRLQDEFGSLSKAFEIALKNPDLLKKKIPKAWADVIIDIAKKSYIEKTYRVRAELKLMCYQPDGIGVIKGILGKAKGSGIEIQYISTPDYLVIGKGKSYKEVESSVERTCESIVKEIRKNNGEGEFKVIE